MTTFEIRCLASGDVAEADDLEAALAAAATLVDDYVASRGSSTRLARRSIIVTRDGIYDGAATRAARSGLRHPGWSVRVGPTAAERATEASAIRAGVERGDPFAYRRSTTPDDVPLDPEAGHDCLTDERFAFVAHYAAPGFGQAWRCEVCGREWAKLGGRFVDPASGLHVLRPDDCV